MKEIMAKENIKIENMIYEVREKQIILDSDVAKLYQTGTKRINEIVKRNITRFPEDFCFPLTKEEYDNLRSQFATSSLETKSTYGGARYLPYAFTEHGVMMLSGLLKSDIAAKVNVSIINALVAMKKYISNNILQQSYINNMVLKHDEEIKILQNTFSKFDTISNELFFEGQIYDAYSLLLDIFNTSKKNIIIIDNYISKELLDILSK